MVSDLLAYNWKVMMFRGGLAILLGFLTLFAPGATLVLALALFGGYCIVDGISSIVSGFRRRQEELPWGTPIAMGLLSITAGVITFAWPLASAFALAIIVAVTLVARGFFEIGTAISFRKEIRGGFWLGLAGFFSAALGIWMLTSPNNAAAVVIALISAYAFIYGIAILTTAFAFRRNRDQLGEKVEGLLYGAEKPTTASRRREQRA